MYYHIKKTLYTCQICWIGHQQKRQPKLLDWAPAETYLEKLQDWAPAETHPAKLLDWAQAETIQFELLENSRPLAFARFWQLSYLQKGPFDLRIENFALRNETSPASFSTSEQVHSRGTEHIIHVPQRAAKLQAVKLFLFFKNYIFLFIYHIVI